MGTLIAAVLAEAVMGRHVPVLMFVVLTLVACRQPNPSGLTKEQAEAVLLSVATLTPLHGGEVVA
jgi:hypothetical protein